MTFLHSEYNSKINLSAKEMLEISQEINRDFTPCFSNVMPELPKKIRLSPKELLDIGEKISRDFAPKLSLNLPELTLLPVDPSHLYAYWNLGENPLPDTNGSDQLTLRIYPQQQSADSETLPWFDVAVDSPKAQQQIPVPCPVDETVYSAAIGKYCVDDRFVILAHSNIIHAPRGWTAWHQDHAPPTYCKTASAQGISKQA